MIFLNQSERRSFIEISGMSDKQSVLDQLLTLPRPFVCALSGNLGAGKTTLVRDFFQCLGFTGYVKSPSFSIFEIYEDIQFLHIDLYRLQEANRDQLFALGLADFLDEGYSAFFEWPERLAAGTLNFDIKVAIEFDGNNRSYHIM